MSTLLVWLANHVATAPTLAPVTTDSIQLVGPDAPCAVFIIAPVIGMKNISTSLRDVTLTVGVFAVDEQELATLERLADRDQWPGVVLTFERGRFIAVFVDEPTISTRGGIEVGDPESTVTERLKSDPTYERYTNRYNNEIYEIVIGTGTLLTTPSVVSAGRGRGLNMRFYSKDGRVSGITAGEAGYVLMDKLEGADESGC